VGRDDVLRHGVAQALHLLGYAALEADDGDTAVSLYRQNGDQIILILFDVEDPLGEAGAAYRRLHALAPRLPAITLSSYHQQTLRARLGADGFFPLRKPITIETLNEAIEALLPRPAPELPMKG
jgi:CheY-like chemotaxis protein